ncbi:MAG TPA: hypothetical protein VFX16_15885 [Pseudonocardiaceae bacterium]|nr:hypothetical protein [Pseudonocardiaceae bacterium]
MTEQVDLVVIGGGTAGIIAARTAVSLGTLVTLVEASGPAGTACGPDVCPAGRSSPRQPPPIGPEPEAPE